MITSLIEKKGGLRRLEKENLAFYQTIQDLQLVDLETSIGIYTWNNRRGGKNQIARRLDRYLPSENIMQGHWHIENRILPIVGSDHWPISINISFPTDKEAKPFRFEKFWLTHANFTTKIKDW